jgi:hypothetical protein
MFKKLLITLVVFSFTTTYSDVAYAADNEPSYTKIKLVDLDTFDEYRYKITEEFFNLRNKYELENKINIASANKILDIAEEGYDYLPMSLINKNYYNHLKTAVER